MQTGQGRTLVVRGFYRGRKRGAGQPGSGHECSATTDDTLLPRTYKALVRASTHSYGLATTPLPQYFHADIARFTRCRLPLQKVRGCYSSTLTSCPLHQPGLFPPSVCPSDIFMPFVISMMAYLRRNFTDHGLSCRRHYNCVYPACRRHRRVRKS